MKTSRGHKALYRVPGFFSLRPPSLRTAMELLFSSKGLLVLSPILAPGSVYYPPRGRDGWGVAAGWGLRGLASVMSAVSPLHFEADAPIVRDVVDQPSAFHDACFTGPVARVEFLPLADAVAAREEGEPATRVTVVTAFHGGLLGDPSVRAHIRDVLLNAPQRAEIKFRRSATKSTSR